ncbi:MAG: lipocalin family protein [Saprospiraceae bacterium]|nr:lipocalin family protein [Saprospiraceae bacterium]
MKNFNFWLPITLLLFVLTSSCKKDKLSPCQLLEGNWQCESWREDGEEQLGSIALISYSKLDFDKLSGGKGDFDWIVNYNDGTSEVISGKYEVNTNCSEVTFSLTTGEILDLDFVINDDELTLEGNLDGLAVELDFKRD